VAAVVSDGVTMVVAGDGRHVLAIGSSGSTIEVAVVVVGD